MKTMKKITCRECGAKTVSEAPERLCFSCQIARAAESGDSEFFFDEADDSTVFDGLEERLAAAVDSIRVESEIGRGSMGVVFRAVQTKLERPVAVKVMPSWPGADDNFAERFLAEGRAMARLHHAHIVTIHDFGQTDCGLSYIVMEYVDGESLAGIAERGAVPPEQFVHVIAQVADALSYAHDLDIVHRDMKPDNILVDSTGRAKIADFGIAKLEGPRHAARLTKTHQILGTPLYMAPEQALASRAVDHRADLYALGVMLHEGLTGELPGKDPEPPSATSKIDHRVDELVASLLVKDPADRESSAANVSRTCAEIARTWSTAPKKRGLLGRMFGVKN